MDAARGITPTIDDELCREHFGCSIDALPKTPPRIVAVRAGRRSGKTSRLLAPAALHAAWTCPVEHVAAGEILYAVIVAADLKQARQVLTFIRGYVDGSPILRAAKTDETADYVELRRVDGNRVRVEVLSASNRTGRSRSCVYAAIDEVAFLDADGADVSDTETARALSLALVPAAQLWGASSPWVEGVGWLETTFARDFGTHANALCVQGGTRALNPHWDPDGSIERELRASDPLAAAREIDAVPLGGGSEVLIDAGALAKCVDRDRSPSLPPRPGQWITFAGDLGFVHDGAALVGAFPGSGAPHEIAHLDLLLPSKGAPLQFGAVVRRFADTIKHYGARTIILDSFNRAAAIDEFAKYGIRVANAPEGAPGKASTHLLAKRLVNEGRVRFPDDARLLSQLRAITTRPTAGGGLTFSVRRSIGAGHGDLASAAILALWCCDSVREAAAHAGAVDESRLRRIEAAQDVFECRIPGTTTRERLFREGRISRIQYDAAAWDALPQDEKDARQAEIDRIHPGNRWRRRA